jgi:hypothetical protein
MNEILERSGAPDPEVVRQAEAYILTLPQIDLGTTHIVHGDVSVRTIFIPAGGHVTGALTNIANVCLIHGDITVTTDNGPQRFTGFHVLPAQPGAKRYGVAHADTYWTTVHHTKLTDIADIEDEMTNESALLQTRRDGIEYAKPIELEG